MQGSNLHYYQQDWQPSLPGTSKIIIYFLFGISYVIILYSATIVPYLPILLIVAPICLFGVLSRPFVALCVLTLGHYFYIRSTIEINIGEIGFGLFAYLFLFIAYFRYLMLDNKPIFDSFENKALFIFILFCLLSFIPAILGGSNPANWARELIPLSFYLFFVVAQNEITSAKRIRIIATCFLILGFVIAIKNIWNYYKLVTMAEQAWQFLASRQTANEPVLMTILVTCFSLGLSMQKLWQRIFLLLIALGFGMALVLTFSRGYWIAAIIALAVVFMLAGKIQKQRFVSYGAIFSVLSISIALILFGPLVDFVFNALATRINTLGAVGRDASLAERFKETSVVLEMVKLNPILGYGLGKLYSFRSLVGRDMPTHYVHNGYLYLTFKLGIFAAVAYLAFFVTIIFRGLKLVKSALQPFEQSIVRSIVAILISFVPLSITSPQFYTKDSIWIIVLGGGIICALFKQRLVRANV